MKRMRYLITFIIVLLASSAGAAELCAKQGANESCVTTTTSQNLMVAFWKGEWNTAHPGEEYPDTAQGTLDFVAEQWLAPLLSEREGSYRNVLAGRFRAQVDADDPAQISAKCEQLGLTADCED